MAVAVPMGVKNVGVLVNAAVPVTILFIIVLAVSPTRELAYIQPLTNNCVAPTIETSPTL